MDLAAKDVIVSLRRNLESNLFQREYTSKPLQSGGDSLATVGSTIIANDFAIDRVNFTIDRATRT